MRQLPWNFILFALFTTSCTQMCGVNRNEMTPDQVVEAYLETALNLSSVDQRDELIEFTTGDLASAIARASDDSIQKAYVDKKYQLKEYSLMKRVDRTPRETEITYLLTYNENLKDSKEGDEQPLVKTENTVAVVKIKGRWLIKDVLGNKTSIEFPVTELNTINVKKP